MFKKVIAVFMLIVFVVMLSGCAAHIHKIGQGAQGNDLVEKLGIIKVIPEQSPYKNNIYKIRK